MKLSVLGMGYVGLITAVGLLEKGHNIKKVVGVDIKAERVKRVNQGDPVIYEKGLTPLLKKHIRQKKFIATTDVEAAIANTDVTMIAVGTPSKYSGNMDVEYIKQVSESIGNALKEKDGYHLIVMRSTVQPGTMEKVVLPRIQLYSGKSFPQDFGLVSIPEFLREGSALVDFFNPDRIVFGVKDSRSKKIIEQIYKKYTCVKYFTGFSEAEFIKYGGNAALAQKISLANQLGNICKAIGIDTNDVMKGVGLDVRIGPKFLVAGIGFGGSCFPKDVSAIEFMGRRKGVDTSFLKSALDLNAKQPLKLLEILEKYDYRKKRIGVLGVTFKGGTDDIRESSALIILNKLILEEVYPILFDPKGMDKAKKIYPQLKYVKSGQEVIDKSDIVLVLSDWEEFTKLQYGDTQVLDGKNIFFNMPKSKRPINYEGVCW